MQQGNGAFGFGNDWHLVEEQCARRHLQAVLPHGLGKVPRVQIHHECLEALFGGVKCNVNGVSGLADATLVLCDHGDFHSH
ncbi:hypothetical protein D3C86_1818280 [compost metagenome]